MFNLTDVEVLPEALTKHYGHTIELLRDVLQAARDGTTSNSHWTLHGIPKVEFYRMLHPFLKKWKVTHSLPKTTIGKIYLSIDAQLQARGSTAYNTYRFIEKLVFSNVPDSAIMSYGTDKSIKELRAEFKCCTEQVESLDIKLLQQQEQISEMRKEIDKTKTELTKVAIEKKGFERAASSLQSQLHQANKNWEEAIDDLLHQEDDFIAPTESDISLCSENTDDCVVSFQTKDKRQYSEEVRKLYYTLLADQIPPAKVSRTIKAVLKCFVPSADTTTLRLPQERCARYMRREELRTVSMAQKAYTISECESLNLKLILMVPQSF